MRKVEIVAGRKKPAQGMGDIELRTYADGSIAPVKSKLPEDVNARKRLFLTKLAESKSKAEAARLAGVSRQNVNYWLKTDPDFVSAVAQTRAVVVEEKIVPLIWDLATGDRTKDGVPSFPALKYLAERMAPDEWGVNRNVNVSGHIVHQSVPLPEQPADMPVIDADGNIVEQDDDEDGDDE